MDLDTQNKQMIKYRYWIFALFLFSCSGEPKPEQNTVEIEKSMTNEDKGVKEESFYMETPPELKEYTEEQKKQKYPGANRPDKVFGDSMNTVSIGVSLDIEKVTEDELPLFIKSAKEGLLQNRDVKWESDGFEMINGRKFAILKFYSNSPDGWIYNLMTSTSHNGKLAMITFNCMKSDLEKWEEKFVTSLNSIQFNDKSI